MPAGCQFLARCRIFLGEKPIFPRSSSLYVALEDTPLFMNEINEPVKVDLPVLNWFVWNVDETNNHTIWLAAKWLTPEEMYEKKAAESLEALVDAIVGGSK